MDNESGGAVYFGILAALYAGATYVAASANLQAGMLFGLFGITLILISWRVFFRVDNLRQYQARTGRARAW